MLAHSLLQKDLHAPTAQAEAVTEAIIRHQDIGTTGKITSLGQLLQLATIFGMRLWFLLCLIGWLLAPRILSGLTRGTDNMGGHAELVHKETIEDVVKHYPRKKWSSCFATTIKKENRLKPWAHTTALGEREFPEGVENNELMKPYDGWGRNHLGKTSLQIYKTHLIPSAQVLSLFSTFHPPVSPKQNTHYHTTPHQSPQSYSASPSP